MEDPRETGSVFLGFRVHDDPYPRGPREVPPPPPTEPPGRGRRGGNGLHIQPHSKTNSFFSQKYRFTIFPLARLRPPHLSSCARLEPHPPAAKVLGGLDTPVCPSDSRPTRWTRGHRSGPTTPQGTKTKCPADLSRRLRPQGAVVPPERGGPTDAPLLPPLSGVPSRTMKFRDVYK